MCGQTVTVKGNWCGIVDIDIIVKGSSANKESVDAATKVLQDELSSHIKEAILEIFDNLPDGGEVRISDVCVEPFRVIDENSKEFKNDNKEHSQNN